MAFDFKALQDDVLDICQEIQGKPDFTLVRVKEMINRGYTNFMVTADARLAVLTFTTVANQVFYGVSDTAPFEFVYKIVSILYITETSEFGKPLLPYPGGHTNLPRNKSFGEPAYYYTQGLGTPNRQKFGTYPIVNVSSEQLEVQGYASPAAALSANGDLPILEDRYRDALVYYAVWRLFSSYGHLNRDWRAKALEYKANYREVINDFKFTNYETDIGGIQVHDVYQDYY